MSNTEKFDSSIPINQDALSKKPKVSMETRNEPMSRYTAADILREVAELGESGINPDQTGHSIEDVARAFVRIYGNSAYSPETILEEIKKAFSSWYDFDKRDYRDSATD